MSVSVDFLSGLYNRHACYADRLASDEIDAIHIATQLETAVERWLLAKKDVVLLGNPGDGKTHLIRKVENVVSRTRPEFVLDATAESDYGNLIRKWRDAEKSGRPFCLAINQGPLERLIAHGGPAFAQLVETEQQVRSSIYYDAAAAEPQKVVVIDLNLRSVLTPEIILTVIKRMLTPVILDSCPEIFANQNSDASLNRLALSDPRVQERIVQLLLAASYTGRHVSMRDLQGFISYLVFGGRTRMELIEDPSNGAYRYFNLCFSGEGALFDAVRDVFEPERATVPSIDEHLWENTGIREGWIFGRPLVTPDHLDDAWELFASIKRQYFFEHKDGSKLLGLQRDDDAAFFAVLNQSASYAEQFLPRVLKAINIFFCPHDHDDGMSLRLWGSQQYDTHSPRVLVSCYKIAMEKFELLVPKLAPWLALNMDYRPDHLLLRYKAGSTNSIGLRIDRGLWRAFGLAERGMPMALRSPQYSKAIQTFITRLYSKEARPQPLEYVSSYNISLDRVTRVIVDRRTGRYTA